MLITIVILSVGHCPALPPPSTTSATSREALQAFNILIGSWKGTGSPEGVSREQRAAGFWTETIVWNWHFKNDSSWLSATFHKGKHFTQGELRWLPEKSHYQLVLTAPDKSTRTFTGTLKAKLLTLDRTDPPAGESQRFVINMLHSNRFLYWLESRPAGSTLGYHKTYQVGATKEGVPFANAPKGPECIVSGGLGTIKVMYKGQEYRVCCSGCREEFLASPEKYILEAERKAKAKK